MHIKSVTLTSFRSFASAQAELDPHINVVVGHNGAGKSNFFEALMMGLLGQRISSQERRFYIYEGSAGHGDDGPVFGHGKATVEIQLDNSDRRLCCDGDTVTVTRSITAKSDDMYLQNKKISRNSWVSLMEAAGFTSANPYFVVRQGQVAFLAICSNAQRLRAIEEFAGVTIFEKKIKRSHKNMEKTEKLLNEIDEMIDRVEAQLDGLRKEKDALEKRNKLDKKRRAIEYILKNRENLSNVETLKAVEDDIEKSRAYLNEIKASLIPLQLRMQDEQQKLAEHEKRLELHREEIDNLIEQRTSLGTRVASLEEKINGIEEEISKDEDLRKELMPKLDEARRNKFEAEKQRESLNLKYEEANERYIELQKQRGDVEQKFRELCCMKFQDFSSDIEREEYRTRKREQYKFELLEAKKVIEKRETILRKIVADQKQNEIDLTGFAEKKEELTSAIEREERQRNLLSRSEGELREEHNLLNKKRCERLEEYSRLKESAGKSRQDLCKNADTRSLIGGLESLSKIRETFLTENDLDFKDGFYGTVNNCFSPVTQNLNIAFSNTLGLKLFHVIVDKATLATRILSRMKEMQLPGTVSFLAVDKIAFKKRTNYPTIEKAAPLIKYIAIEKDESFSNAEKRTEDLDRIKTFLFGKTMLTDSGEQANACRAEGLDSITLDGEQTFSKGVLKGGFYMKGKSRVDLFNEYSRVSARLEELEKGLKVIESQIETIEARRNKLSAQIRSHCKTLDRLYIQMNQLRCDIKSARTVNKELKEDFEKEKDLLQDAQVKLSEINGKLSAINLTEVPSSTQDDRLKQELNDLNKKVKVAFKERNALDKKRRQLENQIDENLMKIVQELEENIPEEVTVNEKRNQAASMRINLKSGKNMLISTVQELKEREIELEKQFAAYESMKVKVLETTTTKCKNIQDKFDFESNKLNDLMQKKTKINTQMSVEVGATIPADEVEKMNHMPNKELLKKLRVVQNALDGIGDVNPIADREFGKATEALDEWIKKCQSYKKDHDSCLKLIEEIENQRHNKIQFTCKQISKYFSEIFEQLTSGGRGNLTYEYADKGSQGFRSGSSTSSSSDDRSTPVEQRLVGASLEVSFNQHELMTDLRQLSGGQKSLVALALIFAFQKCDPTPFYIMDEIDAALDPNHRRKVIEWMVAQKEQYICSTFRKEFVAFSDKCLGVKFLSQSSHISVISQEDADEFLENASTQTQ